MPSKMRKDIYIFVKDKTFIRSASFPRVMTHFYFSLPRKSIFMISFYSSFFISFLCSFYSSDLFIVFLHPMTPHNPMKKNYEEKRGGCVISL